MASGWRSASTGISSQGGSVVVSNVTEHGQPIGIRRVVAASAGYRDRL